MSPGVSSQQEVPCRFRVQSTATPCWCWLHGLHHLHWNKSTNCAWEEKGAGDGAGGLGRTGFSLTLNKVTRCWQPPWVTGLMLRRKGPGPHQTWEATFFLLAQSGNHFWFYNQSWPKKYPWEHLRFSPEIPVAVLVIRRCWGLNFILTHAFTGKISAILKSPKP